MIKPAPSPVQRQAFSLVYLITSLPSFFLSGLFFLTWVDPYAIEETMVLSLALIMLLEFINVHSSAIMENIIIGDAPRVKKALTIVGLGLFYTLFVGAFSLAFSAWWPVAAFWGLTVNRLLGVLLGKAPSGEEKMMMQNSWAVSVFFYVIFAGMTGFIPVPEFGITAEVISRQGFSGEGLWELEPQRVIVFGFLYFGVIGLFELFSYRWIPLASVRGAGALPE